MITSLPTNSRGEIACRIIRSLRAFAPSRELNAPCGRRPSVSALHCHLPQRAVGGFFGMNVWCDKILPELVSGRGTAAAGGGGGACDA
jgi:hypothetical protein